MIGALIFMGIALACILLKMQVEKRCLPQRDGCDATKLGLLAFERQTSAYALFTEAGRVWSFSNAKIEQDFNRYLRKGDIPHYVSRYLRSQPVSHPSYQSTLFVRHDLPPNLNP